MRAITAAFALGALWLAVPATADAQTAPKAARPQPKTIPMQIGGVVLTVPIPQGYCVPGGDDLPIAQWLSGLDEENHTYLQLNSCGPAADDADYVLIKGMRKLQFVDVALKELFEQAGDEFKESEPLAIPETEAQLRKELTKLSGTEMDVKLQVAPKGMDETCGYMGGIIDVKNGETAVGICMTAIGGRVITVAFYAPGKDPATVAKLLVTAKALAQQIAGASGF